MCPDFRSLNKLTMKDNFPFPIIDDLLDELSGVYILTLYNYYCKHILSKRIENIQWKIHTLHRFFSLGSSNWEKQHIIYSFIVIYCLQYNIHIGANNIQNPN
jgi:hypothetical protein